MPSTAIARRDTDFQSNLSLEAQLVRNALIEKGLETPMSGIKLSRDEKYTRIRDAMTQVATALGLDLNYESFPKISLIKNKMNTEEMIKVKAVKVISTCEHHFVTIDGLANVAYLPGKKIIGLSKINRIVSFFAQRPQVQERLTQQILVALQTLLDTRDVAVFIDATHYCVKARGIMDASSRTETSALGGLFKSDQSLRDNFLNNQRR